MSPMPRPVESQAVPPTPIGLSAETTAVDLDLQGDLPTGLSGCLLAIGPGPSSDRGVSAGMVHSVRLHAGGAASYRSRWVVTDAVARQLGVDPSPGPRNDGPDMIASNIVVFGGSILALGDRSLAYELSPDLDTLRRVDLAGQARSLGSNPRRDPLTGDLHVLAAAPGGAQAHVVVAANALTRTSRTITTAPNQVKELAITRHHVAYVADGFAGVAPRDGGGPITWITTGVDGAYPVQAHDTATAVVVHTLTPALERWTLHATSATVSREVLDPTPRRWALTHDDAAGAPRFLWATGEGTADSYDLLAGLHSHRMFRPGQPCGLAIAADRARSGPTDAGWIVGFIHHPDSRTDLVVLDAADLARPAIATAPLPRPASQNLHSIWLPGRLP